MVLKIGADGGNNEVKIIGPHGEMKFFSDLGEYRELIDEAKNRSGAIVYEFEGKKGFAGSLAKYESEFGGSMMGDSKAHEDFKIRILIGLHLYSHYENEFCLVVGQPLGKHKKDEKTAIKSLLEGQHTIIVNDEKKDIYIKRVEVAPEGASAFFARPIQGKVRIIDVGSGTINLATIENNRFIDRDSNTLTFGMNTTKTKDIGALSRAIINETSKKWSKKDKVYIVGGPAEYVLPYIQGHYHYAEVVYPIVEGLGEEEPYHVEPIFANASGFYHLAKDRFKDE